MSDTKVYKNVEDPSSKELNQFVQNLLKQMQERFEDMSGNIIGRIDEMGSLTNI
jgi:heat shock factor-binding protein 1